MTETLFQSDSYLSNCVAKVIQSDSRGLQFDQTVFYAKGGGQPGDSGTVTDASGNQLAIVDTVKDPDSGEHIHIIESEYPLPAPGEQCELAIDWDRRYRFMRMHSCLHLLCALIDAPVTGGSIQEGKGRLDFDLSEPLDKEKLGNALNALIAADHPMTMQWITQEELDLQPELIRTLSVKPPRGNTNKGGKIRLINFEGIDLQPCGGTHIASTAEIGKVTVQKIEKKGRQNRRVNLVFNDSDLQ